METPTTEADNVRNEDRPAGELPPCPFAVVAPTPFYTPGGCSARILGEIEGLAETHRPPTTFTYGTGTDLPGIPVVRSGPSVRGLTTGFHWSRPGLDLLLSRTLLAYRDLPATLHVHLYEGGLIGKVVRQLRGIPYVVDLQGSLVEESARYAKAGFGRWAAHRLARIERLVEDGAGYVVTSSPSMLEFVRTHSPEVAERLVCVDDGVPARAVLTPSERDRARTKSRESFGDAAEDFVIAYLGSLSRSQGIDSVLEAAPSILRSVPNARFRLFGVPNPGSSIEQYRAMAGRLGVGDRVQFPGAVPYDDATRTLAGADVAVTWKANPFEANGKVPFYMGAGVPTVALRTPIAEHYLGRDGSKGGVVAASVDAAIDGVVRLAHEPSSRQKLGEAALATARAELTWSARAARLLNLHRNLVGS